MESNIIEQIHQHYINLHRKNDKSPKIIDQALYSFLEKDIIPFLDKEHSISLANELFYFINLCFEHYPKELLPIFDNIYKKSRSNSNYTIITLSILNRLTKFQLISLTEYDSFVQETISQLLPQIKTTDQISIQLFEHKIHRKFLLTLILNLLLLVDITEEIVIYFIPYIFSLKFKRDYEYEYIISIMQKISEKDLLHVIPKPVKMPPLFFQRISLIQSTNFIKIISKTDFFLIYTKISDLLKEGEPFDRQFAITYIQKCTDAKLQVVCIEKLLETLSKNDITREMWNFLKVFDFRLPKTFDIDYKDFENDDFFYFKIVSNPDHLPTQNLKTALVKADDLGMYENILFNLGYRDDVLKTKEFWSHIFLVFSKSGGVSSNLFQKFVQLYEELFDDDDPIEFFDELIFSDFFNKSKVIKALSIFARSFSDKNKKKFNSKENIDKILDKLIQLKKFPVPEFWYFIPYEIITQKAINNPCPLFLYAFGIYENTFADEKIANIQPIEFPDLDEKSRLEMISFMSDNNFEKINNLNEELLLFFSSALAFFKSGGQIKIAKLPKENVLLLFIISANYILIQFDSIHISQQIIDIINESLKILADHYSVLESAALVLFNSLLSSNEFFPQNMLLTIFEKVIEAISTGKITQNLSCSVVYPIFYYSHCKEAAYIFDKYGKFMFSYVIDNMKAVRFNYNKFPNSRYTHLNMIQFQDKKMICEIFQNLPDEKIIDSILLYNSFCVSKSGPLPFTNTEFVKKMVDILINTNQLHMLKHVFDFTRVNRIEEPIKYIYNNENIPKPYKLKYCRVQYSKSDLLDYAAYILECKEFPNCEVDNLLKSFLYDKQILLNYLAIIVETLSKNKVISPKKILNSFAKEFLEFKDDFIKALSFVYIYDPEKDLFIKKPFIDRKSIAPSSEIVDSVLTFIFDSLQKNPYNHNAFYCLKRIASMYPFLFAKYPKRIFESVLPAFQFIHSLAYLQQNRIEELFNTDNDEILMNNIKAAISALSFLYATLASIDVLIAFFEWFFENCEKFDKVQLFGFLIVLVSALYKNPKLIILIRKFDLLDKIMHLFEQTSNEIYMKRIKGFLVNLTFQYYSLIDGFDYHDFIYYDTHKNNNEYLFLAGIPEYLIYRHDFPDPFQYLEIKKEECSGKNRIVFDYIESISKFFHFDVLNDFTLRNIRMNDNSAKLLSISFMKLFPPAEKSKQQQILPSIPLPITLNMMRLINPQNNAFFFYIYDQNPELNYYPEYYEIITKTADEFNEIARKNDKDDIPYQNFEMTKYIEDDYKKKKLYKLFILSEYSFDENIWIAISINDTGLISVLEAIYEVLNYDLSFSLFAKICNYIQYLVISLNFKKYFKEIVCKKLVSVSLGPKTRTREPIPLSISILMSEFTGDELPSNINEFIDFILILDFPDLFSRAISLCARLGYDKIGNEIELIQQAMKFEKISKMDTIDIIYKFFEYFPDFNAVKKEELIKFINEIMDKYLAIKKDMNLNELDMLVDLLARIFKSLIPKRNKNQQLFAEASQNDELFIPSSFMKESDNWEIIKQIQKNFNDFIKKDCILLKKISTALEYPEIISFENRFQFFEYLFQYGFSTDQSINILIDRLNLIESSFVQMRSLTKEALSKFTQIIFKGEKGIDEGGVTRDWLFNLSDQIMNPSYQLFVLNENGFTLPNPNSYIKEDHLDYFNFIGRIIAQCITEKVCINPHLSPILCRHILKQKITLDDFKDYDNQIYQNLRFYLDNDIDSLGLETYFEIDVKTDSGKVETVELIENGSKIKVTNENKNQYVDLMIDYKTTKCVNDQINEFCNGFYTIIPFDYIKYFSAKELYLLICGASTINIEDLKKIFIFEKPYNINTPIIKFFFNVISSWDKENHEKLLIFITGSSRIQYILENQSKITITRISDVNKLPQVHTCSLTLDLPEYESEEILRNKLTFAIQECNSFGFI